MSLKKFISNETKERIADYITQGMDLESLVQFFYETKLSQLKELSDEDIINQSEMFGYENIITENDEENEDA